MVRLEMTEHKEQGRSENTNGTIVLLWVWCHVDGIWKRWWHGGIFWQSLNGCWWNEYVVILWTSVFATPAVCRCHRVPVIVAGVSFVCHSMLAWYSWAGQPETLQKFRRRCKQMKRCKIDGKYGIYAHHCGYIPRPSPGLAYHRQSRDEAMYLVGGHLRVVSAWVSW